MSAKYEQLASILRSEIRQLRRQGGTKLAPETELAQRYHMSRQTVRHALKILENEGLIERRQGSGSYILEQDTVKEDIRQIAVITTFLDDYIFPTILHDAQNSFSRAGYSTLVYATENKVSREREILTKILEQKVSAVLIEGSKTAFPTPNSDLYQMLQGRGIPVLFLHGIYSNLSGFPCLLDDNYHGGYLLGKHLITKGHTRICGIFKADDIQGPQRYHGVVSALRDHNLPIRDNGFFWYDTEDRTALVCAGGRGILDSFIQDRLGSASAVVCYNDEIAHYLIKRLLEAGKSVPEDVAVVSFDNSFYCQLGPIPLTSLGHKSGRTGKIAAAMLLEMLTGKQVQSVFMDWELTSRSSG